MSAKSLNDSEFGQVTYLDDMGAGLDDFSNPYLFSQFLSLNI